MAVKELDHRCWVLDGPPESGENGPHFGSADDAERAVEGDATTRQLPAPCSVVICDKPGCGEELENGDEGWTVHLAAAADDVNCAVTHGWTANADGTLTCYFCPGDEGEDDNA